MVSWYCLLTPQAVINSGLLYASNVLSTTHSSLKFYVAPECSHAGYMKVAAAVSLYAQ